MNSVVAKKNPATISEKDARDIAKEAYVYGFPLVDNYRILYSYFVDRNDPEYKTNWNSIYNTARVYTPADKAVQSPNSDTPYSFVGVDLRAEPLVFTMPEIEQGRYYSAQFIDLYTFNFAYVGSRATGNNSASFLLAGPNWKGDKPAGIEKILHCETELALVLYRTQLLSPDDIDNVKKIQSGYKVQPLSQFLGKTTPPPPPKIQFEKPLSPDEERQSPDFFRILNFVLQFCPTHVTETTLMERFARLGIGAGKSFDVQNLSPALRKAIEEGIADAWKIKDEVHKLINKGKVNSGKLFGTRAFLANNYPYRMAAAAGGIYGNSKEEAYYPVYYVDSAGHPIDTTERCYALRFLPGQLPPVNAFWSLTLYEMPSQLLSENPLNRYLINSPMLPKLKRDADGGITIFIQHESPGKAKELNWLPAPKGKIKLALRLYWPRPSLAEWKAPALERIV